MDVKEVLFCERSRPFQAENHVFSAKKRERCERSVKEEERLSLNIKESYFLLSLLSHTSLPTPSACIARARVKEVLPHSSRAILARYFPAMTFSLARGKPRVLNHSLFAVSASAPCCARRARTTHNTNYARTRTHGATGRDCWPTLAAETEVTL
jgi:hypothetical protein